MATWLNMDRHFDARMMVLTVGARDFVNTHLADAIRTNDPVVIEAAAMAMILAGEPSLDGGWISAIHYDVYSRMVKISYVHGSFAPVPVGQNLKEMPVLLPHIERVYNSVGPCTYVIKNVSLDELKAWNKRVNEIMEAHIKKVCSELGVPHRVFTGPPDGYATARLNKQSAKEKWEKIVKPVMKDIGDKVVEQAHEAGARLGPIKEIDLECQALLKYAEEPMVDIDEAVLDMNGTSNMKQYMFSLDLPLLVVKRSDFILDLTKEPAPASSPQETPPMKFMRGAVQHPPMTVDVMPDKREFVETDADAPWNQVVNGMKPGDLCCMRATGMRCYEHDPNNYTGFKCIPAPRPEPLL